MLPNVSPKPWCAGDMATFIRVKLATNGLLSQVTTPEGRYGRTVKVLTNDVKRARTIIAPLLPELGKPVGYVWQSREEVKSAVVYDGDSPKFVLPGAGRWTLRYLTVAVKVGWLPGYPKEEVN